MTDRATTRESAREWAQVAALTLCCLAANLLMLIGTASAKNCALKLLGSADISVAPDSIVLVHVTINGHPASMQLDTASVSSMLQAAYAEPLGLHVFPAAVHRDFRSTTDTLDMSQFVHLTSLEVGTAKLGKPRMWVLPDAAHVTASPLGTADRPDVGRLGVDVIGGLDFELDFVNNRLIFYSTDHCPGAGAHWTRHPTRAPMTKAPRGNLLFPVEIDGKRVEAVMSTADPHSWMLTNATRQLYGFDETSAGIDADSDAGGKPLYYRHMTLSGFGPNPRPVNIELATRTVDPTCLLTSRNFGAAYYLGQACRGYEAALYLGMDVLRQFHIYYAAKEQVLYFSAAAVSK